MATRAKLKFRGDMPWYLEHKLMTKYGFRVHSRKNPEWLIVEKLKPTWTPEILTNGELPEETQNTLIRRCNTIVNQFNDPVAHIITLRIRVDNMAKTLPPIQRKFVQDWAERNLGDDSDALPHL